MNIASIRGLTKRYPSFVLDDVSFDLNEGRITGFIGRNGAGKTTTIKSMLNLVHQDSGEIVFFNKKLQGYEAEIKSRIGYSTGSVNWYPKKKIRDIVKIQKTFYREWDDDSFLTYAELFKIDTGKTPSELSEGMKVKCNLMLALSHKAEFLILDEPTGSLDPFSRNELLEVFLLLKEKGVTIFFSTHIISDIEACADDILYISGGRIAADMSKEDFMLTYSKSGENLEKIFLRFEKERNDA